MQSYLEPGALSASGKNILKVTMGTNGEGISKVTLEINLCFSATVTAETQGLLPLPEHSHLTRYHQHSSLSLLSSSDGGKVSASLLAIGDLKGFHTDHALPHVGT